MGSGSGRKFLGLLLLVSFPASTILADSNAAMLYAKGAVAVNGAGATRSSAVFVGDKIQTKADSSVTISSAGTTLIVPANSSVVYEGNAVEVGAGAVQINTTRNMSARVDELTVTPANGNATFQVSKLNGTVTVAAERGNVVVSDGDSDKVVKEGTSQTTSDDQIPDPGHKKKKKRGGALPLPPAGNAAGQAALIGAGIGVAAIGTAAAVITTGAPESPSSPRR